MPWSEDELRRALDREAERARPRDDALALLRARSRRRDRTRTVGFAFAGATAAVVLIVAALTIRGAEPRRDVEFAGPPAVAPEKTKADVISEEPDGGSILAEISGDGRFVVFMSDASNLLPGDTNGHSDTFVRDLATGTVERASVSSSGDQGNADSLSASISRNGRFVAFRSRASNLVANDSNGRTDIFLRDRDSRTTTLVSIAPGGAANGDSDAASISGDGRFVAFRSLASNLVANDRNGVADIFVRDMRDEALVRVSVSSGGKEANSDSRTPQISADGTRVTFSSFASTLVTGDTNRTWDVFLHDLAGRTTERISVASKGAQANGASTFPSISADGRVVAFISQASSLVRDDTNRARDAFVRDVEAGTTERVSVQPDGGQADKPTFFAAVSGTGRYVAISSDASNLVGDDRNGRRDIFVIDRSSGAVTLASVSSDEQAGNLDSGGPSISAGGRFVAFQSWASTLSAGDTNAVRDVFVRDLANRTTGRASR